MMLILKLVNVEDRPTLRRAGDYAEFNVANGRRCCYVSGWGNTLKDKEGALLRFSF